MVSQRERIRNSFIDPMTFIVKCACVCERININYRYLNEIIMGFQRETPSFVCLMIITDTLIFINFYLRIYKWYLYISPRKL